MTMALPDALMNAAGAVPADGLDAGVAAHYGDPIREQRLWVEGLAEPGPVAPGRADHHWSGPPFVAAQPHQPAAGRPAAAPFGGEPPLSPKGHIEANLHVIDDGETTWITTEPGAGPALLAWLEKMRFMLRVEATDRTRDYALLGEPIRAEGAAGAAHLARLRGRGQ